jgi:hypothetical protein
MVGRHKGKKMVEQRRRWKNHRDRMDTVLFIGDT